MIYKITYDENDGEGEQFMYLLEKQIISIEKIQTPSRTHVSLDEVAEVRMLSRHQMRWSDIDGNTQQIPKVVKIESV